MADWWEDNRTRFPVRVGDNDYSGSDFTSAFFANSTDLSHSFFNGTTITSSAFVNAGMDQCELAEALIIDTVFSNVDFTGSDFVRTTLRNVRFERCIFTNGEWRETEIDNCIFDGCDFSHTTINLCAFKGCSFSLLPNLGLNHKAINYNTFSRCTFTAPITSQYVLTQNFGLPYEPGIAATTLVTDRDTLKQICLTSGSGKTRVVDLIRAVETECERLKAKPNKFVLEFLSRIVATLATEQRISASSMIYVEELFAGVARSATATANFQAAMNAIICIRSAIYDAATQSSRISSPDEACQQFTMHYSETFDKDDALRFGQSVSEIIFDDNGLVKLTKFSTGSSFMEYALVGVTSVTTIMIALNLLLAQADIMVRKITRIKDDLGALFTGKAMPSAPPPMAEKLPAILRTGAVMPQLVPVKVAVQKNGETLIRLDDRVEIVLYY